MTADRKWVERNLGFDPISTPPPAEAFTVKRVATSAVKRNAKVAPEDFQREIIDFDSEAPEGRAFVAFSTSTGLSRFTDIPWPKRLAPKTGAEAKRHRQRPAAEGRRAGGDLDGRRRPCAEPRAHPGEGFPQRLRVLHA